MANALTWVGIEVPRTPQVLPDGRVLSTGEWEAGGVSLLDRWIQIALHVAPPSRIRLVTGEPDQHVFDLAAANGLLEVNLTDWVNTLSERGKNAGKDDALVLMRGACVLASPATVRESLATLRRLSHVDRVEPAAIPRRQSLSGLYSLDRNGSLSTLASQLPDAPLPEMAFPVPIFEVQRLRALARGFEPTAHPRNVGFVWVEESEFAVVDSLLGLLYAERICEQHPVPPPPDWESE